LSETAESATRKVQPYDLFMLGLSVYVLLALAVAAFLPLDGQSRQVLQSADNAVCVVFLADFVRNFIRADHKLEYLRWGWLDLLASIPTIDALRFARLARVVRIIRVLRGFRSARQLIAFVLQRRAQSAFWGMALASFILLVFASITILEVERDAPGANITSARDAVWWAYVTITTVGYGDRFPVTTEGPADRGGPDGCGGGALRDLHRLRRDVVPLARRGGAGARHQPPGAARGRTRGRGAHPGARWRHHRVGDE
jgi:voltage-gated potassium channel